MQVGQACTSGVAAHQICTAAVVNFGAPELPQTAACTGVIGYSLTALGPAQMPRLCAGQKPTQLIAAQPAAACRAKLIQLIVTDCMLRQCVLSCRCPCWSAWGSQSVHWTRLRSAGIQTWCTMSSSGDTAAIDQLFSRWSLFMFAAVL